MRHWLVFASTLLVVTATVGAVGTTDAVDLDGDGVAVAAELDRGTDPLDTDTDGDGLDDGVEREHGTDPTAADTDGDGIDDGAEVESATDPTAADTDDDGLDDGRERDLGTNATVPDTDGDGLSDGREATLGTDPTSVDTDEDGLADGTEVEDGTDPTAADTDSDGLDDGREREVGTDATVADTDGDGLDDGTEVAGPTDPASADTDGDGLDDGREREMGTNATVADTDGDGLLDGWEVAGETPDGAPLPDADPARMDLYVVAASGADSALPTGFEALRADWAGMPVENPDGSTGISLHVVETHALDHRETFDGSSGDFGRLHDEHYERLLGDGEGAYYLSVFLSVDAGRTVGWGYVDGRFSAVDGGANDRKQHRILTHELLHNVVGDIEADGRCPDDSHHYCEGGYLEPTLDGESYLPEAIGEEIARDGFGD